jgi:hypothetical protein
MVAPAGTVVPALRVRLQRTVEYVATWGSVPVIEARLLSKTPSAASGFIEL